MQMFVLKSYLQLALHSICGPLFTLGSYTANRSHQVIMSIIAQMQHANPVKVTVALTAKSHNQHDNKQCMERQITLPSSDATRLWATVLKVPKMLLA